VGDYTEDQDSFDEALQMFIASNCTAEDRHELVQQLRHPHKPRDINVQHFYYRLLKLNSYVEWMPGRGEFLTEDQVCQSFYDDMPGPWRDKFVNTGTIVSDLTIAEHMRYFRQQESFRFESIVKRQHVILQLERPSFQETMATTRLQKSVLRR
jgi:hypothetical protein